MYWAGFIIGRLLGAYLTVWLVLFLVKKFRYKESVAALHSRGGIIAVVSLFVIVGLVSLGKQVSTGGAGI